MAKKKSASQKKQKPETNSQEPTAESNAHIELETAASQVQTAREALAAAQHHYEQAREQAADKIEELRETTVGELVDGALEFVKKNPGAGVFASGILGFIIGRLSKR